MTIHAPDTLFALENVNFRYPDGSMGLQDCSIAIARGSRNALIGANGSGKTTLFQHANALLRPQSGVVYYAGRPQDYSRTGLRELRSRVGMVFQNPDRQLFSASVLEDVSFGPMNMGLEASLVRERVEAALETVDMLAYRESPVHSLSFGQKKRVCIAGVLAMKPELLILDEPMAGLDAGMQAVLLGHLQKLHQQNITLLLATHDVDFAFEWADYLHLMVAGRCVTSFPVREAGRQARVLAEAGLPLPAVLLLHQALVQKGWFSSSDPVPASMAGLLRQIATADQKNGADHDFPTQFSRGTYQ